MAACASVDSARGFLPDIDSRFAMGEKILMLGSRRIAAKSIANSLARQLGEGWGNYLESYRDG